MAKVKTICFTVHRLDKLGGYEQNNPVAVWVKERLRCAIERAIGRGVTGFISGGALGVNQWAAEIVIERLGISTNYWNYDDFCGHFLL